MGSSSQSQRFAFHLSITLGQLPPKPPAKATFQLVKNHLAYFSNGVLASSTVEFQLSYLSVYFDENLSLVLASAGLSWLSLCSDNLAQHTSSCSSQLPSVCVCCFVSCMLSILKSAAVINEQNFNLLSSSHLNVGAF